MEKSQRLLLLRDRETKGLTYRTLARKYDVSIGYISNVIKSNKEHQLKQAAPPLAPMIIDEALPGDIKLLKEEIRRLKLKIELQDIIIDVSGKELGVDLRKKRGTRRS